MAGLESCRDSQDLVVRSLHGIERKKKFKAIKLPSQGHNVTGS